MANFWLKIEDVKFDVGLNITYIFLIRLIMGFVTIYLTYLFGGIIIGFILFIIWVILDVKGFNKIKEVIEYIMDSIFSFL
jgi:hypothetical protein